MSLRCSRPPHRGFDNLSPQRGTISKPKVVVKRLPWENTIKRSLPQRGLIHLPSCPSRFPRFISISYSPPKSAAPSSGIKRSARKCMPSSVESRKNSIARPSSSAGWKITCTSSPAMAGPSPRRIGSRNSSEVPASGSRKGTQSYRILPGRQDTAFFPLAPRISMPLPITSQDRKSIIGNQHSKMNSGRCCKNTGSSGTSDMCGIERTQPRWGRFSSDGHPRVGRRSSGQPWALRKIPVGEICAIRTIHRQPPTMSISRFMESIPQRGFIPKPGVERHELPWVPAPHRFLPQRGSIQIIIEGGQP